VLGEVKQRGSTRRRPWIFKANGVAGMNLQRRRSTLMANT
jgi:hypothetical protein